MVSLRRRIGLLIWCDQRCRIDHADLAQSLGINFHGFLSQTLSIFRSQINSMIRCWRSLAQLMRGQGECGRSRNCIGDSIVDRNSTRFRVESREFKRPKWDNLCDRNSNTESGFESR